jgi:ribosomal protein S18 acetylase RimI-like enzyme
VRSLEATTVEQVEAAAPLYDGPPIRPATDAFLADPRHHLLVALDDGGRTVGFISGVEMTHPDKGTEMFLYELVVSQDARKQGIGLALTASLADLARSQGCYGTWVGVDTDNAAAHATHRAAGSRQLSTLRRRSHRRDSCQICASCRRRHHLLFRRHPC